MCEHKNLKTIGDRLFCKDCGQELPIEFLGAVNKPVKAQKPAEEEKTGKTTGRKRTPKKAV